MTSNIGSEHILNGEDGKVYNELHNYFKPEFINRIDEVIVFKKLTKDVLYEILDKIIFDIEKRLSDINIKINLSDSAKTYLIDNGYDEFYGARPLKRLVNKELETKLAKLMINNDIKEDMAINMIAVDNIGVTGSEDSGGVGYIGTHYVETIKQNFIINTNDNTVIVNKGFKVVKSNDGDYGLLILKEGSTTEICPDMKYEEDNLELNVAFAGLVITKTVGTKVYVQTSYVVGNWGYENGITILKNDLAGDQYNLNTYDIEEEAMIVDDTQI
jgi:hypothetical protein